MTEEKETIVETSNDEKEVEVKENVMDTVVHDENAEVITLRKLIENGVHYGHQTRKWNPKMKPVI